MLHSLCSLRLCNKCQSLACSGGYTKASGTAAVRLLADDSIPMSVAATAAITSTTAAHAHAQANLQAGRHTQRDCGRLLLLMKNTALHVHDTSSCASRLGVHG